MALIPAFTKDEIIPDLLDAAVEKVLKISYNSGVELNPGDILTPTQVKDQPNVAFDVVDGDFYTLLMTDLDAPSKAVNFNFNH